jgi:NADH dehydrogenase (ubiquinone) 1 alpha subcomplex subunit 9
VHMSHINAREEPDVAFLGRGSRFLASKYQGELAVRAEFPEATVFRPADVYGQGDSFLNYWMSIVRKNKSAGLSLYGKGEMTVKQPIWHSDLVTGIINSLYDPSAVGQTYEAVGPDRLTQAELMRYMYALTTRNEADGTFAISELMLDPWSMAKAYVAGKMPFGNGSIFHNSSLDRMESDAISDFSDGYPDMSESLGVKLHTLAEKLPWEVAPWDLHAYYHYETVEEKPVVPAPTILNLEEERKLLGRRSKGLLALIPGVV